MSLRYPMLCPEPCHCCCPLGGSSSCAASPRSEDGGAQGGGGCRPGPETVEDWEALQESIMCWARLASVSSALCGSFQTLGTTCALQECGSLDGAVLDVRALLGTDVPLEVAAGAMTASPAGDTAMVPELCCFLHPAEMSVVHICSFIIVHN